MSIHALSYTQWDALTSDVVDNQVADAAADYGMFKRSSGSLVEAYKSTAILHGTVLADAAASRWNNYSSRGDGVLLAGWTRVEAVAHQADLI